MNQVAFWKLIDVTRRRSEGDLEAFAEELENALVELAPQEIVRFEEIYDEYRFRAYRRPLWGAAYLLNGGCSDDGFEYFRGWLIAQGQKVYEKALADPDSLAGFVGGDTEDFELEEVLYAPSQAYERKTGKALERRRVHPELVGPEWSEDQLESLFPGIAKKLSNE